MRIVSKDKSFLTDSSSLSNWNVTLRASDKSTLSVTWKLIYCLGFGAREFHQACDGAGKFVVVVKAVNGRISVAYNDDGFFSDDSMSPNRNTVSLYRSMRMGAVRLNRSKW
jgi:hypothetical protein